MMNRFDKDKAFLYLNLKKNRSKYLKVCSVLLCLIILIGGIIYFTYAKFSTSGSYKISNTTVDTFKATDYKLTAYVNGTEVDTFPAKNSGYSVDKIECTNGATATWNYNLWAATTSNITSKTKCSVYFIEKNVYTDSTGASIPELYQGLIPIKYVDGYPIVADTSQEWYNYANHNWANAVLVNTADSSIKAKYFNDNMTINQASIGQTVDMNDILQMYVWIPRYKYLLWNAANGSSNEQAISITFEDKTIAKSNGTSNGTWLTHPAFTFGVTELNGIWVGKFENSGTTSQVMIKPNLQSLTNINLSTIFNSIQSVENNTAYGLNSTSIDTHLMKNMEWGAVAYLSSSIYGRYTNATTCIASGCEIWINNINTGYGSEPVVKGKPQYGPAITGCSGSSVSAGWSNSQTACASNYDWKTNGVNASTTGNQYGIYDMSGGTWEYVMGNMFNASGSFYSSSAGFSTVPDTKYFDSYDYDESITSHARGLLGDATKETLKTFGSYAGGWNTSMSILPHSVYSWFGRGGGSNDNANNVDIFFFGDGNGSADSGISFRSVLTSQ